MSDEMQKRDRAVSAKVQDRLDILKEQLSKKYKRSQIIQYVRNSHKDWKVSIGTIDSYIKKARIQLIEESTQTRAMLKCEAATDLRYLYGKALDEGDISEARRCRAELNKLYNLYGNNGMLEEDHGVEKDVTPREVQQQLDDVFKAEQIEVTNEPDVAAPATKRDEPTTTKFADLGF